LIRKELFLIRNLAHNLPAARQTVQILLDI